MTAVESKARGGIGGHTSPFRGRTDDWITPRSIIDALGPFDLDPCACDPQPWPTATTMFTVQQDGYGREWRGRVWLNPPYGPLTEKWLAKLARHGYGSALIFARTETAMFFSHVWGRASALLFIEGRLHFHYPDGSRAAGNSGGPSVLVAYGELDAGRLLRSGINGKFVNLNPTTEG